MLGIEIIQGLQETLMPGLPPNHTDLQVQSADWESGFLKAPQGESNERPDWEDQSAEQLLIWAQVMRSRSRSASMLNEEST